MAVYQDSYQIETHISNIASTNFAFASVKILKLKLLNGNLCTLEYTNLDESIKCTSRWFIPDQRMQLTLEFVNLKCAAYTTHLGPLKPWQTHRIQFQVHYKWYIKVGIAFNCPNAQAWRTRIVHFS